MIKIEILHDGIVVGTSDLAALDPPMGVAGGRFEPLDAYRPQQHAYCIDGDCRDAVNEIELEARCAEFGIIRCAGVGIEDFHGVDLGRQVTVLGMYSEDYEKAFSTDPVYRAYYGL